MTRRFRLDSATAGEVLELCNDLGWHYYDRELESFQRATDRAQRLLLHWWFLGANPATALRCPRCGGDGMSKAWDNVACGACHGKGWSMPGERS